MQGKAGAYAPVFRRYQDKAEAFLCACLRKGYKNVQVTPGGLIFRQRWNNMQFVTTASFVAAVYSDYLTSSRSSMKCPAGYVQPSELLSFAKSQVGFSVFPSFWWNYPLSSSIFIFVSVWLVTED